jgi:hypothetical protein
MSFLTMERKKKTEFFKLQKMVKNYAQSIDPELPYHGSVDTKDQKVGSNPNLMCKSSIHYLSRTRTTAAE